MLKTQFIQKKEVDSKFDRFRAIMRKDARQAAKEGAYEGVMEAKLELLQTQQETKIDYSPKHMPMTTEEFEKKIKWSWGIRLGILSALAILGFVDFSDVLSFILNPFS